MENDISPSKSNEVPNSFVEASTRKREIAWLQVKKNPPSERNILRGLTGILFICLILLIVTHYLKIQSIKDEKQDLSHKLKKLKPEFCLTERCVQAAARVIGIMDQHVRPCDNFYDFACGSYVRSIVLPDDKSFVTPLSIASDILSEKLRLLVEENSTEYDLPSHKLVKNLYKSCMDLDRIEKDGMKPLERVLESLGGWPVVKGDQWNEEQFSWKETIYKMRKLGFSSNYLFSFTVTPDVRNSSSRIIEIDQAVLGMPSREYLMKGLNDTDVLAYLEFQIELAVALGANRETAAKELEDNVFLEMEIAVHSLPEEQRRDIEKLYNKMMISEFTELAPTIPWLDIFNEFIAPHEKITEEESIIVGVPQFFVELEGLLSKTSKRMIANYLLWHVAASAAPYLDKRTREIELHFSRKISGIGQEAPRWKDCMDLVSSEMSYAVGSLYVRNFFNEASKSEAEDMVSNIKEAFEDNLNTIEWMDWRTRKLALLKSKAIKPLIGYPEEILNETILMKHYEGLLISDGELLSNVANISRYKSEYKIKLLRQKVFKTDWKIYGNAAVVNAFYSPIDNAILFPAGILQGPFFDIHRPKYLNYGSIGFVIGHEITHGFDDEGSQFNANGDLEDWWMRETKQKFLHQTQCIISQYSNFTIPGLGMKLNGVLTQGENIADNGGVKGAYHAYEKWIVKNGEELKLPGLEYTPRQLFWISAAQLWCSKERDEFAKLSVMSKPHSLPRFRILGPMRNIPEFSRDWNCSAETSMNPPRKCSVW